MDFVVKCADLGDLTVRSRKDGVEGTFLHYTITKESKPSGLRSQVNAETSGAAAQCRVPQMLFWRRFTLFPQRSSRYCYITLCSAPFSNIRAAYNPILSFRMPVGTLVRLQLMPVLLQSFYTICSSISQTPTLVPCWVSNVSGDNVYMSSFGFFFYVTMKSIARYCAAGYR